MFKRAKWRIKWPFAGKHIENPESLPLGCHVTLYQKSNQNWWEHGIICLMDDGSKGINCIDGYYNMSEVEVYLDTRYQ